ncbi:MAG: hypothetical protein P0Y59_10005 [Candidatus Sphingomonas phytovorans]|nr:hypothetical protein [Sphingomonas sp.]WEK01985.1 MAG: hypothetical protein P0Y59_10005 [Sphingomonas sp.]
MTSMIRMFSLAVTAMLFGLCFAAPASAQATRTWISGVGDDVNPCSRTAPCKTWAGAISKTAAGGEIDCLDPGGFGSVTITKSITLDCAEGIGGAAGGILNSGVPGVTINDPNGGTAPTIKVTLRNLTIDGAGVTQGTYGVRFLSGKSLTLQNVSIMNQGTGSVPAVSFEPSAASVGATLHMTDVDIVNVQNQGVYITPVSGVAVSAFLNRVTITQAAIGFKVEAGGTATLIDSNLSNNGRALWTASGAATANLEGVTIAGSLEAAVFATNGTTIRLSNVGLYNNAFGIKTTGTGIVQSFGNNRLGPDAGSIGLPTATVTQK